MPVPPIRILYSIMMALAIAVTPSTGVLRAQPQVTTQDAEWGQVFPAEAINNTFLGRQIAVRGVVQRAEASDGRGPSRLVLQGNAAQPLEIVFWKEVSDAVLGGRPMPGAGTRVAARGVVEDFRGRLQLRVSNASNILLEGFANPAVRPVEPEPAVPAMLVNNLPPGVSPAGSAPLPGATDRERMNQYLAGDQFDLVKAQTGRMVSVRGFVAEYTPSWSERAPNIIFLNNGERRVEVVFWPEDNEIANFSQPGTPVYATGLVQDYRGRLQIKIEDIRNLSISPLPQERLAGNLTANPIPTPTRRPPNAAGARPQSIQWHPYSPLRAQEILNRESEVVIYARSENVPRCGEFERMYLLHPDAVKAIGPRTILFLNVNQNESKDFVRSLGIVRVPALIVYEKDMPRRELFYDNNVTPQAIYEFFKSIPR